MARYTTQSDYDVLRGGKCVELFDERRRCLAGVYAIDHEHRVEIEIYNKRTPRAWVGWLSARAWFVLDPFSDGTPLDKGKMPKWFRKFERPARLKALAEKGKLYYQTHKAEIAARHKRNYLRRKAAAAAEQREAAKSGRPRRKAAARTRAQREKGSSGS